MAKEVADKDVWAPLDLDKIGDRAAERAIKRWENLSERPDDG